MDTYEKKYKEALEKIKNLIDKDHNDINVDDVLNIFPELKESEDERIRKGLIKAVSRTFEGNTLFGTDVTREEALAWLEKQGEKKSQRMISAEAKEAMYDKPAWSEENEVRINRIVACLENLNVADNDILLKDVNWLKSLKRIEGE